MIVSAGGGEGESQRVFDGFGGDGRRRSGRTDPRRRAGGIDHGPKTAWGNPDPGLLFPGHADHLARKRGGVWRGNGNDTPPAEGRLITNALP